MSTEVGKPYDNSSIKVLKGLEPVRERPGMYIGDTGDGSGLHHMVFEVLDNSIDEALAGFCSDIWVRIHEDGSCEVTDDGRGIPVDPHPEGPSTAEVILCVLHAGGKFKSGGAYEYSGGLHGVGVSVVNALSEKLYLKIHKDGKIWEQEYANGTPVYPLRPIGETDKTGTSIRFWPSKEIFTNVQEFEYDRLAKRIRELSFLNDGIKIQLNDDRTGRHEVFHHVGGIKAFIDFINMGKQGLLPEPYCFSQKHEETGILVEVGLQWTDNYKENIFCFTNNIPQKDGGTHLTGFRAAFTRVLGGYINNEFAKAKGMPNKFEPEDFRDSLTAIVSVKVPNPSFSSQTKDKLVTGDANTAVQSVLGGKLDEFLQENPKVARAICERVIQAAKNREAERKFREVQRQNKRNSFSVTKLVNCNSNKPEECELYLVEGDSAGGSAVKAREVATQAILPLRGKILNVEKAKFEKIIESQEIINIIGTLKCGVGKDFDLNNLRYHKIVIMTDADVDGSHIRTLLLTFFYRQMKELIEAGKVYIAQPPLYKLTLDKKAVYIKNDEEYENFIINYSLEGAELHIDDKKYTSEELRPLCNAYLKVNEYIHGHHKQYSPEVMSTLLNYRGFDLADLKDQAKTAAWVKGLVDLLGRTQDASVRYIPTEQFDAATGDYNYLLQEIKHGITSELRLDANFFTSRDYQMVKALAEKIDQVIPNSKFESREQQALDAQPTAQQETGDSEADAKANAASAKAQAAIASRSYVTRGRDVRPVVYFSDFMQQLEDIATTKLKPSRYKGLGEMNYEELEHTTMKRDARTLLRVDIKDAIKADQLFTTLMGEDVAPRKEFIEQNAIYANVDLGN